MGRNGSTPDLRDARYAEVAAIQNSLAHMTMPHHGDLGAYGHSTPPPNRGQRSPLLSPSGMHLVPPHHLAGFCSVAEDSSTLYITSGSPQRDPSQLSICMLCLESVSYAARSLCTSHPLVREEMLGGAEDVTVLFELQG